MKAAIKKKWLKALRGESPLGVYEQGRGRLVTEDKKFCCLGVLQNETEGFYGPSLEETEYGWKRLFSLKDMARLGLTESEQMRLSYMNDHGASFAEIADWIEENL